MVQQPMVNIWFLVAVFLTGVLIIELALKPLIETALTDSDPSSEATEPSADTKEPSHSKLTQCLECGTENNYEYSYCYECLAQLR